MQLETRGAAGAAALKDFAAVGQPGVHDLHDDFKALGTSSHNLKWLSSLSNKQLHMSVNPGPMPDQLS